jgi:hypothetical protein
VLYLCNNPYVKLCIEIISDNVKEHAKKFLIRNDCLFFEFEKQKFVGVFFVFFALFINPGGWGGGHHPWIFLWKKLLTRSNVIECHGASIVAL